VDPEDESEPVPPENGLRHLTEIGQVEGIGNGDHTNDHLAYVAENRSQNQVVIGVLLKSYLQPQPRARLPGFCCSS